MHIKQIMSNKNKQQVQTPKGFCETIFLTAGAGIMGIITKNVVKYLHRIGDEKLPSSVNNSGSFLRKNWNLLFATWKGARIVAKERAAFMAAGLGFGIAWSAALIWLSWLVWSEYSAFLRLARAKFLQYLSGKLLYHPGGTKSFQNPKNWRHPSERNLPCEDILIRVEENVQLKGWILSQQNLDSSPTVVFFHENAGNLGDHLDYFKYYFDNAKCNLFVVAYRGYDQSSGSPSKIGIQSDARAILDYIFKRPEIDKNKVFLHGRSLGGAVAAYSAHEYQKKYPIKGLILENTFTSFSDMIGVFTPKFFPKCVKNSLSKWIATGNDWSTIDLVNEIEIPILFISSKRDQLVPFEQMQRLKKAATLAKTKEYVIENGDHNSNWTVDVKKYFRTIFNFINGT